MECRDGCHGPVFEMTVFPLGGVQSADFPMTDRGANAAPSEVPEADKGREIIEAYRQVRVMSDQRRTANVQRVSTALRLQPVDPERNRDWPDC
jgi:hypothetical protein